MEFPSLALLDVALSVKFPRISLVTRSVSEAGLIYAWPSLTLRVTEVALELASVCATSKRALQASNSRAN